MKQLIIMRHGEAENLAANDRDFDRHLSAKGIEQVRSVASQLLDWDKWYPEKFFCSPSQRTRETYEQIHEETKFEADVNYLDQLYVNSWESVLERIEELPSNLKVVFLIGHNPILSELVSNLIHRSINLKPSDLVLLKTPQKTWIDASLTHDWSLVETLKAE